MKWWQSTRAAEMKNDPYNHTRWKHMRGWHNRGCVWDEVATKWAGDEDRACKRVRCQTLEVQEDSSLSLCKASNVTQTKTGMTKKNEDKEPRYWGADKTIHIREEGPTVQLCGDSKVAESWLNGHYALGHKHRGRVGHNQKTLLSWWKNRTSHLKDQQLRKGYLPRT